MLKDIKMFLPIKEAENGGRVVSGRDLYEFVGSHAQYTDWINRMIRRGMFEEHFDYEVVFHKNVKNPLGGRPSKDVAMTMDMAKEVAMMQSSLRGKQARKYFIQVEKEYKEHKVTIPMTNEEKIKAMAQESLETKATVKQNTADIKQLKDTFPISNSQQQELNQLEHALVIDHLGGMDSNAYAQLKGKAFAQCWRDFKRHFKLPKVKFDEGKAYLKMWAPDTDLRIEIKKANNQLNMM